MSATSLLSLLRISTCDTILKIVRILYGWLEMECCKENCSKYFVGTVTPEDTKYSFSVGLDKNLVHVRIANQNIFALVDTGATISCISLTCLQRINRSIKIGKDQQGLPIKGVCGETHSVLGTVELQVSFDGIKVPQKFHVLERLHNEAILGLDFLKDNNAQINLAKNTLTIHKGVVEKEMLPSTSIFSEKCVAQAKVMKEIRIGPRSQQNFRVKISKLKESKNILLEPTDNLVDRKLMGAKCLVHVKKSKAIFRVLNPTNQTILLQRNLVIANAYRLDEQAEITKLNNSHKDTNKSARHQVNSVNPISTNNQHQQNFKSMAKDLGITLENSDLSDNQKDQLFTLLGKNQDVFAKDMSELGVTNQYSHTIITTDNKPIASAPYRQSPDIRREVEKHTKLLLENDIIEPSTSPWHSPVVMVKKKNGLYRMAIDYRKLNKVTESMSFPLPKFEDVVDTLGEAKAQIFSVIDLASGFYQIPLDESTKHKSAFITHQGVFQFKRLPFGLMNSPISFQSLMTKVLQSLLWSTALVYIDDVIIFSKSFAQHLHDLDLVFSKLREAKLTLQPTKCNFACKQVKYLGHIINKDGIQVDPEKTQAISTFPIPKSSKQVKSFLGVCNYYRKFIQGYAKLASPLTKLTAKDIKFSWGPEQADAFQTLKQRLLSAPILVYPDFQKPFIISTDASDQAIGYVLGQRDQQGREQAIAYGGRKLHRDEQKWHISEKEGLSLVEAVKQFRPYVANTKFTIYTDNIALKWLNNIKNMNGRLGRWSLFLQAFNFEIKHKAGAQNTNADGLSRRDYSTQSEQEVTGTVNMCGTSTEKNTCQKDILQVTFAYKYENVQQVMALNPVMATDTQAENNLPEPNDVDVNDGLRAQQQNCPDFEEIIQYIEQREVPEDAGTARRVVAESSSFDIVDGILYHLHQDRNRGIPRDQRVIKQLAVPRVLRDDLLKSYHDSIAGGGHQGYERTYEALRRKYYWPRMYSDVMQYTTSCVNCQRAKRDTHARPAPLQPLPVEDIFCRIHIDIIGPIQKSAQSKNKYNYILLVVDSFSKWCEAFPMFSESSTEIAAILYREIFTRYGAPRTIVTDRGQSFLSKLIKALCELFQITKKNTTSYHPQTNAACERMNSFILQSLRAYCDGKYDKWPELLPSIMMAYRMTPATQSTGYSPYYLMFGREMRMPVDATLIPKDTMARDHKDHLNHVIESLRIARQIATENIQRHQQKYKHQHDKKAEMPKFRILDKVFMFVPKVPVGAPPKLHCKWQGPFYILHEGPNHTYRLADCETNKPLKTLVNAARLKLYKDPRDRPKYEDSSDEEVDDEDEVSSNSSSSDNESDDEADDQQQHGTAAPKDADRPQQLNPPKPDKNIKEILQAKKQGGKTWYKVSYHNQRGTQWRLSSYVDADLRNKYHTERTMAGKRKKPKEGMKYFERASS